VNNVARVDFDCSLKIDKSTADNIEDRKRHGIE
jgi:hypothetical protein